MTKRLHIWPLIGALVALPLFAQNAGEVTGTGGGDGDRSQPGYDPDSNHSYQRNWQLFGAVPSPEHL